jgi:hypothetical protein
LARLYRNCRILLRGDTDFTQTEKLDGWDDAGVGFIFGIDAMPNLVAMANELPPSAWKRLVRGPKYEVKTDPRTQPENVKERIIREPAFENIHLNGEDVAEVGYQPTKCRKIYRLVVVRKNLSRRWPPAPVAGRAGRFSRRREPARGPLAARPARQRWTAR